MLNFFLLSILLLPWIIIPNSKLADPFRLPKNTFFDIICLGIIVYAIHNGMRFYYRNKYLAYLSIWIFITFIFNWYLPYTLTFDNKQLVNTIVIEPMIHYLLALVMSIIVLSTFDKDNYVKIAKAICISSCLITGFGILQVIGLDPYGRMSQYNHPNHFSAFLDNPNIVGSYLALSLPFFLSFSKLKYKLGFILVLIGIYLSGEKLAYIATLISISLFFILYYRRRIIQWGILGALSLIGFYVIIHINTIYKMLNSDRLPCWKIALTYFKANPLFGQGLGITKTLGIKPVDTMWHELHCDYLQIALEIGILGLILLGLVIFNSIRRFNYKSNNLLGYSYLSSLVVFLILMTASFPIYTSSTVLLGLISWYGVEKL